MEVLTQGQYFGSQRLELEQRGISLSEYDYFTKGTPWHYHENPYFMYVIDGQMMDINKSRQSHLDRGSLMFLNWQDPHRTEKHSKTGRGFHLQLDRSWLKANDLDVNLWEGSQKLNDPYIHHILGKIYFEFRQKDNFSAISIESQVMQICQKLSDNQKAASKSQPKWLDDLKELLHESHNDILSLDFLSQELGIHPVHISRSVPKFLNTTLGSYLRQQKIKKAYPLILNNKYSIGDIAMECGFSDQSHFTRTFKSQYDHTPRSFRKLILG